MKTKEQKEELKAQRLRLHKIYLEHDLDAFREFIKDQSVVRPELMPFVDETDKVLNSLMHNMKSQLMYLPDWQDSRNYSRYEMFWADSGRAWDHIPKCISCKFFREGPDGQPPCMEMFASPLDIACLAYEAAPETTV